MTSSSAFLTERKLCFPHLTTEGVLIHFLESWKPKGRESNRSSLIISSSWRAASSFTDKLGQDTCLLPLCHCGTQDKGFILISLSLLVTLLHTIPLPSLPFILEGLTCLTRSYCGFFLDCGLLELGWICPVLVLRLWFSDPWLPLRSFVCWLPVDSHFPSQYESLVYFTFLLLWTLAAWLDFIKFIIIIWNHAYPSRAEIHLDINWYAKNMFWHST